MVMATTLLRLLRATTIVSLILILKASILIQFNCWSFPGSFITSSLSHCPPSVPIPIRARHVVSRLGPDHLHHLTPTLLVPQVACLVSYDHFHGTGFAKKLSIFQDQVLIFFAVLFWMSLFFWSSAWDMYDPNKYMKELRKKLSIPMSDAYRYPAVDL